jgi:hypothetical protein
LVPAKLDPFAAIYQPGKIIWWVIELIRLIYGWYGKCILGFTGVGRDDRDVPLDRIQALLGHKSVVVTQR